MKEAIVFDISFLVFFNILKHNTVTSEADIILIASLLSSPFTNAPITPKLVTLICSYTFYVFYIVINGNIYIYILVLKKFLRVLGSSAMH